MTGARVRPARRNEEEGDGKDGSSVEEAKEYNCSKSLASDVSSTWLCGKTEAEESVLPYANRTR